MSTPPNTSILLELSEKIGEYPSLNKLLSSQPQRIPDVHSKRKCGADFRLSIRRLWKDPIRNKRHNTPHSDRYGVSGHAECARPQVSIRKWVLFRIALLIKKTSTFSDKDLRKTLSQYVMSGDVESSDSTNIGKLFHSNNTHNFPLHTVLSSAS